MFEHCPTRTAADVIHPQRFDVIEIIRRNPAVLIRLDQALFGGHPETAVRALDYGVIISQAGESMDNIQPSISNQLPKFTPRSGTISPWP